MEEIYSIISSITEKIKVLEQRGNELDKDSYNNKQIIEQLENENNILNNQLSEEKQKVLSAKKTVRELLNEVDECLKIYSEK